MKINHALAVAISALSAGLLISCVKPAEENQAPDTDSQIAQDSNRHMMSFDNHLQVL